MITRNIEIVLYIDEKTHEARSRYLICENGEPKIKWKSEEAITCARALMLIADNILEQTAGVLISAREKEVDSDIERTARHFYELGLKARKEK